jgi:hypothetical protein
VRQILIREELRLEVGAWHDDRRGNGAAGRLRAILVAWSSGCDAIAPPGAVALPTGGQTTGDTLGAWTSRHRWRDTARRALLGPTALTWYTGFMERQRSGTTSELGAA